MEVIAFSPGEIYPIVSITDNLCVLNCKYCQGYYLKNMYSASTPARLFSTIKDLHSKGARGILISGGFTKDGVLSIKPFLSTIKKVKKDFDLIISLHPGLVDKFLATEIRRSNVDIVDYELILDPEVIKDVKGLNKSPSDYTESLELLVKYGPAYIAPHVPIGLKYSKIVEEKKAIDFLMNFNLYLVSFLIFIPTINTMMANCEIPKKEDVINLFNYARKLRGEIALGCMRPSTFKDKIDHELLEKNLIDRIATPANKIVKEHNLNVIKACCSIPREFFSKFTS